MGHQVRRVSVVVATLCLILAGTRADRVVAQSWVQQIVTGIPVSGTSVTLNDVAPTADRWNLAVVEIVAR
jgi:hypothetical protein